MDSGHHGRLSSIVESSIIIGMTAVFCGMVIARSMKGVSDPRPKEGTSKTNSNTNDTEKASGSSSNNSNKDDYAHASREKRFALTTVVKKGMMESYKEKHDNIFPEVAAGLRISGVKDLIIFQEPGDSNRLFMFIVMQGDLDLDNIGSKSLYRDVTNNPRIMEWETLMESHFEGGKWTLLDEIHSSDVEWNVALSKVNNFSLSFIPSSTNISKLSGSTAAATTNSKQTPVSQ